MSSSDPCSQSNPKVRMSRAEQRIATDADDEARISQNPTSAPSLRFPSSRALLIALPSLCTPRRVQEARVVNSAYELDVSFKAKTIQGYAQVGARVQANSPSVRRGAATDAMADASRFIAHSPINSPHSAPTQHDVRTASRAWPASCWPSLALNYDLPCIACPSLDRSSMCKWRRQGRVS